MAGPALLEEEEEEEEGVEVARVGVALHGER